MDRLRCYHCGHVCETDAAAIWSTCTVCAEAVHVPTARRVAAWERLARAVAAETELDESERAALLGILEGHRNRVLQTVPPIAAEEAEPPAPPVEPEAKAPPRPARTPRAPARVPPSGMPTRPRTPSLWSRLGPVFGENLLFALAGFLLVAGAVYFTTTAWTTMSGTTQKLVVAGGLLLFAALAHGAGVALAKGEGLKVAARVLSLVAAALVPAATAVTGLMLEENATLALVAAAAATAAGHLFLVVLARREGGAVRRSAPWLYDALVFAGVFAPSLTDFRLTASTAVAAAAVVAAVLLRKARDGVAMHGAAAGSVLLAVVFAALAFAANLAIAVGPPVTVSVAPVGVVVAAAALAQAVLESARNTPAPTLLITALTVAIAGTAMATGDLRCLMVAAWCAAFTGGQGSLRTDRARLLVPALALSAVGYLFLPAPVRELALRLRAEAAIQLGYEPQRLPLSFYGLTFLPYLLGLALLASWFRRRDRVRHRRVVGAWAMSVAAGLAGMALLLGDDLRAPAMVLPADGLLLVLLGYLGGSRGAVFAGALGVLGGLVCALAWFEVPAGVGTAAVAGAVLLLLRLSRESAGEEGIRAQARGSYRLAAATATGGLFLWLAYVGWPPDRATPWSLLHACALAPMLVLLRSHPRLRDVPAAALLPLPALWATATGVAATFAAVGIAGEGGALPAALALVTLGSGALLHRLRGGGARPRQDVVLVAGLFALHVLLVPGLVADLQSQPFAWSAIVGTAALAVAAGWLAVRVRVDALLAVAVVEGAFPLHLLAGAWLGDAAGPPGLLGPAAVALGADLLARRRAAVHGTAGCLAALLGVLLLEARLSAIPGVVATEHGFAALLTCALLLFLPLWRIRDLRPMREPTDVAWLVGGALAAVLAPIALLDLLVSGVQYYAAAFLGIAGAAFALATRFRRAAPLLAGYGLVEVAFATVLTYVWQPGGDSEHLWRLGLFVAAAALSIACRPRALRTPATFVVLGAAFGAAVLQPIELDWVPRRWFSVPTLGLCALALGATATPRLAARAVAVRVVTIPLVGAAALFFVVFCAVVMSGQLRRDPNDLALFDANALAFLAAALALAAHSRSRWRTWLAWTAIASTAFGTAPVNALLHGHRDVFFRPDVEAALLALAAAIVGRRHPQGGGWILGGIAAACTAFELQDVSTPVTTTLLAGLPLVLLLRGSPGPYALLHGWLLLLASWSWIVFALLGEEATQLGPWLGLSAAALPVAAVPWLRRFAPGTGTEAQLHALRASAWLLALGVMAVHCLRTDGLAPALDVVASLLTCALVVAGSLQAVRVPERAPMVQLALAAAIIAWLVLATGTTLLSPLDGKHHHGLTVMGATLFLAAGSGRSPIRAQFLGAGIAAPLLAIALAASLGGLTFSLLAGAAAMGLGAAVNRSRWLAVLSLALLNAGLFQLWLEEGVFDPSFYGVPAGLSLVFGAELVRRNLPAARLAALRVTGLAVVYGSVLVQVARVSAPAHALLLFLLAMAAVGYGTVRRQAAVLVTGVAAVVLDVVTYLAQRGFEQDFLGSVLLVGAGGALFVVAARVAKRRVRQAMPGD